MQLPNNLAPLGEFLNKLPQERMAKAVSLLLVVYIAYLLAQITWQLIPSAPLSQSNQVDFQRTDRVKNNSVFDVSGFQSLNLFGQFDLNSAEEQLPVVQDAPETRLNLTLSGVVASSDSKTAAAIIEQNGVQETYGIGDKINGTRAQLAQVHSDRVLIKQSGRMETLMLDGFDYSKNAAVVAKPSSASNKKPINNKSTDSPRNNRAQETVDLRNNKALSQTVQSLKRDVAENPGKITDYLRISPKRSQGKVVGYRLMPGKQPEFFKSSGLKSGDVAIQMNGLDLSIPSESAQALKALREDSDISLLIDRNGEITEILFSIAK